MAQAADFTEEQLPEGGTILRLGGTLAISQIGELDERLRVSSAEVRQIDLSQIDHIDTVGAWLVYRTARDRGAQIVGADSDAQRLIAAVSGSDDIEVETPKLSPALRVLHEVGEAERLSLLHRISMAATRAVNREHGVSFDDVVRAG